MFAIFFSDDREKERKLSVLDEVQSDIRSNTKEHVA